MDSRSHYDLICNVSLSLFTTPQGVAFRLDPLESSHWCLTERNTDFIRTSFAQSQGVRYPISLKLLLAQTAQHR